MQGDHAKDVIEYRNCGQNAQNSQVKSYASQQLPVLQQHESHVNQAAVALGLPSAGEAIPASGRIEGSSNSRDTMGTSGSSGMSGSAANPISPANTGAPSTPNGSTIGATGTPNSSNNSTGGSNSSGR
jgi:hypothetical protein